MEKSGSSRRKKMTLKTHRIIILIFVVLCIATAGSYMQKDYLRAAKKLNITYDKKKLESGELQVFTYTYPLEKGGEGKRVVGIMLINAAPEKVWKVLENWDAMGKYVPSLEYYKTRHIIKPISDNTVGESYIEGKLKVAFLSILYTLHVSFDKASMSQEWKLVNADEIKNLKQQNIILTEASSSLKNIRGFEYIEPYDDGSKTIYYYAPIVEVSAPVPAWIERQLSKSSLNEYMEGVKKKVEENR
jgi:hypothetical protein